MKTLTIQGLSHLHTEIFGTKGKPAIAHRLKPDNVFADVFTSVFVALVKMKMLLIFLSLLS